MALLRGAARAPPDEALEEVAVLEDEALAEDEVSFSWHTLQWQIIHWKPLIM